MAWVSQLYYINTPDIVKGLDGCAVETAEEKTTQMQMRSLCSQDKLLFYPERSQV